MPHSIEYDTNNTLHLDFIASAANIRAHMYGIEGSADRDGIAKIAAAVVIEKFVPKSGVRIATTEAEAARNDGVMGERVFLVIISCDRDGCENIYKCYGRVAGRDEDTSSLTGEVLY